MEKSDVLGIIKSLCFHDSFIIKLNEYKFSGREDISVWGDFSEEETLRTGLKCWRLYFDKVQERITDGDICDCGDAEVIKLNIDYSDGLYKADMFFLNAPGECVSLKIECESVRLTRMKYKGMSYRNLYDTPELYSANEKMLYAESDQYLKESKALELPDGYTLESKSYSDISSGCVKAALIKYTLKKDGHEIFSWRSFDGHHRPFAEFVRHSNGHRYYPFYVDLYGICYIDVDTLESYCYVPEGWEHDCSYPCGESFIVTDIHYNSACDLIAYGGCYWAVPSSVMVGDFSKPLGFDPQLIDVHDFGLDPDYEEGFDFDFVGWTDYALVVKDDNNRKYEIEIGKIKDRLLKGISKNLV